MPTKDYYLTHIKARVNNYDPRDKETAALMHIQYMLARSQEMFSYTGLPDTVPARMLELFLQTSGHCAFARHQGEVYVYTGGLGGEPDEYYRPTLYTIANPAQGWSRALRIGTECVVIRNDSLYLGLLPLFERYARALAENELSLFVTDINSRMVTLISASDDRTIESARRYLEDIERGKIGVIGENAFLEGLRAQPLTTSGSRSGILDLMEYEQYLTASWYNSIGLDSNYNMKRERLNTAEVEMNNDSLAPLVDDMLHSRELALKEANELFGLDMHVELSSAWRRNELEADAMLEHLTDPESGPDADQSEEGGDADADSDKT